MSSPIPPDPYETLGVPRDAEISAIRTAHRKLVLKHHPDRIKDPALKERGKDAFQKIQVAYELLSDPVRRQRYHDQLKLAELRKEAMMREPPSRTHAYPSRHTPSASASREWNSDDQTYYELRKPKEASYFDSKERFEEPQRASSRKYPEYERSSSTKKPPSEAPRGDSNPRAKAAWGAAYAAVNFGIKVKKESDKKKETKSHVKEQELRDREKRKARQEKEQQTRRQFVESEDDSGSDTATRVTSSTIRPSKPSPRPTREREPQRSSGATRHHAFADDDSDQESTHSRKWESHHERTREYLAKAASMAGARPNFDRSDSASYWNGRKSMDENVRRPTSSRGRHEYDEPPARPSIPTHTSAPSNLKSRVDDRVDPRPRRSATGSHPIHERDSTDHRKEIPGFHRAQTMPTPRPSSKKDAAPSKSSNLKHTETHDSGYGSSSSPHTPEMRGESPSHRPKETKTKYQIVDPESDDDTRSRIRPVDSSDSDNRRRRYRSQEPVRRESDRRREKSDRPEGPKLNTDMRSKTTREALSDRPKMRHSETSRYDARSPRDSPPLSRQGSGRDKLPFEVSDGEREPSRYQYTPKEKVNIRQPHQDPKYSNYPTRESTDRRSHDHAPGSHFQENVRHPTSRRPSVY